MERKMKAFCRTTGLGLLAAALLTLCPAAGEAASLADILKEKGVITSAEYQQATKDQPTVSYQAGKGLTVASADGNSKLQIGGYAQILYRLTDTDAQDKDNQSNFNIRRFKLVLQGTLFSDNFGYRFQGDVSSGFRTEDVFFNYKFGAPLIVQVGQFKPPQARQELTGAGKQLFPERSLANDTFNLGRDQGVQAAGSFAGKLIEYRAGIFNGNGPNTSNPDANHMIAGRIDVNPLGAYAMDEAGWPRDKPLLNLGASAAWEKVTAADVGSAFSTDDDVMDVALNLDGLTSAGFTAAYGKDLTWLLWTANLNATWLGASFASEYYHLGASPQLGQSWSAHGYYVQGGYQIVPDTLELAVRYTAVKSDSTTATRLVSAVFDKAQTQFGVNYYFRKHLAKLQADFTTVDDHHSANKNDGIVRLQAQFYY
jgi:phosphate-selective porin